MIQVHGGVRLVAVLAISGLVMGQTAGDPHQALETAKIELPKRIPHPKPDLPDIPELPDAAASLPDLTLEFQETVRGAEGTRPEPVRILTRSTDRVHLRVSGRDSQEWLFLQNPVDPRRVEGILIDHTEDSVVQHFESDLRNAGIARGWLDVLCPGLDPRALADLSPDGEETEFGGVSFRKLVPKIARPEGIQEVWWSSELLIPLRVTRKAGDVTLTHELTTLTRGVSKELLEDPRKRFPGYTVVDFADWHEEH